MFEDNRHELRADVLKASHHGSSNGTNSGVLLNVKPEYVVISCGFGNVYHYPHPSVMKLLKKASEMKLNTKLYRTDLQGTITLSCDGESILAEMEKVVDELRLYMSGDETVASFAVAAR
jgi:beta-lactamase superfamily II metal-dependent hydrolase